MHCHARWRLRGVRIGVEQSVVAKADHVTVLQTVLANKPGLDHGAVRALEVQQPVTIRIADEQSMLSAHETTADAQIAIIDGLGKPFCRVDLQSIAADMSFSVATIHAKANNKHDRIGNSGGNTAAGTV